MRDCQDNMIILFVQNSSPFFSIWVKGGIQRRFSRCTNLLLSENVARLSFYDVQSISRVENKTITFYGWLFKVPCRQSEGVVTLKKTKDIQNSFTIDVITRWRRRCVVWRTLPPGYVHVFERCWHIVRLASSRGMNQSSRTDASADFLKPLGLWSVRSFDHEINLRLQWKGQLMIAIPKTG